MVARTATHGAREVAPGLRQTGGWMLPPPRTPAVRAQRRPILQIVDDEEIAETASSSRPAPEPSALITLWRRRSTELIVAAGVVALASGAMLFLVLSGKPASAVASASLTETKQAAPSEAVTSPSPEPSIPVVDVNSLPPAR